MIKKLLFVAALSVLAGAASAQVFEPARIYTGNTVQYGNSLQIHLCSFKEEDHGARSTNSALIAGEFSLRDKASLGFWISTNEQGANDHNSSWIEGHGTYYWRRNDRSSLGILGGILSTRADGNFGTETIQWFETALVGSCTLDTAGKTHLGATLGWGFCSNSSSRHEWAHDIVTWSLSLSHYVTPKVSIDASTWTMDLQGGGSPILNRYTVGVGFHF